MSNRPHWTQTPAGKRKMSLAQRKSYSRRRALEAELVRPPQPPTPKSLAVQQMRLLAVIGAKVELARLEKECDKLRMFLGAEA